MSDDREYNSEYMKDPRAKSLAGLVAAIEILAKAFPEGMDAKFKFAAEHDVIYSYASLENIPESSEDGLALVRLGWHVEEDGWAYFT